MDATHEFYERLAPLYHLVYPDWDASVRRQAAMLDDAIRTTWGSDTSTVLDVSCGIGTQAIGLAGLGYRVTGSDLCREQIRRARIEADRFGVEIDFSIADMREASGHHGREFDVVISCDNSVPHLLTDEDILTAFREFLACTRPGGGCLVSVRDYEKEDLTATRIHPLGFREEDGTRWIVFQVWTPRERIYDLAMYLVEDRGDPECRTLVLRTRYYAVGIPTLIDLMEKAGFDDVRRMDGAFFQPVIVGTRPE